MRLIERWGIKIIKINKSQGFALRKWATISSTIPSSALSGFLGREVELDVVTIKVLLLKELSNLVSGPKKLIVGVHAPVSGGLSGNVILVLPKESALLLSAILQGRSESKETLDEEDRLSLKKIGDILTSSYVDSLCDFFGVKACYTGLGIVSTFGESVVDFVSLGISERIKQCLLLETYFRVVNTKIEGDFILVIALESIDRLLERIKKIEN